MSRADEELALRKEILVARSSLTRLQVRQEALLLRHSLSWRRVGAAAAASPAARDAVFLLAAAGLGRSRVARWLAVAGRILAVVRLTTFALQLLRTPRTPAAGQPPP